MQVTNVSRSIQIFTDASGIDVEIAPGETKPVDIFETDPRFAAARTANLVTVDEKAADPERPAPRRGKANPTVARPAHPPRTARP